MKKYILASAAAVALSIALPSMAAAQTTINLDHVDAAYVRADIGGFNADGYAVSGAALITNGGFNVQIDANLGEIEDASSGGAAVHVFHRNDSWALGGFVGFSDAEGADEVLTYGVEGAKYFEQVTLSAGVAQAEEDSLNIEALVLQAGARFFATDNVSFNANFANVDVDGLGDLDIWGVGAEFKTSTPLSIFASFDTANDADVDIWSLGVRWNIGHETLKARDRNGATTFGGASATRFLF